MSLRRRLKRRRKMKRRRKNQKRLKKIEPKKPTVHTKVWEENKVYLYQSSRTPQIPSISPQELKLESWLKLHGISYENVDHKAKLTSKRGTLPFIELNGEEVTDAATFQTLSEKFGKDMSAHLTQEQKNVEHAMIKMVRTIFSGPSCNGGPALRTTPSRLTIFTYQHSSPRRPHWGFSTFISSSTFARRSGSR